MSNARLGRPRAAVRPRFRCLVCRVFVTGGEDGTCPRCGWTPPGLTEQARGPTASGWWAAGQVSRADGSAVARSRSSPTARPARPVVVPAWLVVAMIAAAAIGALLALGL